MPLSQPKAKSATASQKFIEIQDVKNDILILKNGGLRAVCIASSINFELKGNEEQQALIGRFQGFLNSLDFPLQILVNSRKLNIDPYLESLEELAKTQENELLHAQTLEYVEFIRKFIELTDIMNKSFYVVIPYNPAGAKEKSLIDKIKYIVKPREAIQEVSPEKFQEYKDQLIQRVNHVIGGLGELEIKTAPLRTEQLIRLFYEFYNPGRK